MAVGGCSLGLPGPWCEGKGSRSREEGPEFEDLRAEKDY